MIKNNGALWERGIARGSLAANSSQETLKLLRNVRHCARMTDIGPVNSYLINSWKWMVGIIVMVTQNATPN